VKRQIKFLLKFFNKSFILFQKQVFFGNIYSVKKLGLQPTKMLSWFGLEGSTSVKFLIEKEGRYSYRP